MKKWIAKIINSNIGWWVCYFFLVLSMKKVHIVISFITEFFFLNLCIHCAPTSHYIWLCHCSGYFPALDFHLNLSVPKLYWKLSCISYSIDLCIEFICSCSLVYLDDMVFRLSWNLVGPKFQLTSIGLNVFASDPVSCLVS